MVTDPLTDILCESDVVSIWPGDRDNDVDEMHDGSLVGSCVHNILVF